MTTRAKLKGKIMNQTDERNSTSAVCAACGTEYDNRSGGTAGQTYYTKKDHCELSLCENCIEDAHREQVVSSLEALNGDLLEVEDFDKLSAWAKKGRILLFCDETLQTKEDVEKFFDALSALIGWHPDSDFADYIGLPDGDQMFDEVESTALNTRMQEAFEICDRIDRTNKGSEGLVYKLALESAFRAGWAPKPETSMKELNETAMCQCGHTVESHDCETGKCYHGSGIGNTCACSKFKLEQSQPIKWQNDEVINVATKAAWEAIGEVLVKHFPEAVSGDLSPSQQIGFEAALKAHITAWVDNNVPKNANNAIAKD